MKDLKTVMGALERCSRHLDDCDEGCPYWDIVLCDAQLMQDALGYLKQMSGEEVGGCS